LVERGHLPDCVLGYQRGTVAHCHRPFASVFRSACHRLEFSLCSILTGKEVAFEHESCVFKQAMKVLLNLFWQSEKMENTANTNMFIMQQARGL